MDPLKLEEKSHISSDSVIWILFKVNEIASLIHQPCVKNASLGLKRWLSH